MSSWDFMQKSVIYVTGNISVNIYTEIFALDLSSLLIVRANNFAIS